MARYSPPKRAKVLVTFDENGVNAAGFLDMLRYDGAKVTGQKKLPDLDRYGRPVFEIALEADGFEVRRWNSMGIAIIVEGGY